jgi:hypothetical protein
LNGVIAFAFWTSTLLNTEASLIDGLKTIDASGMNKLSYSQVWFQKEHIGSEIALSTAANYSLGPLQPMYSLSLTSRNGLWIGAGFSNTIRLTDTLNAKFSFLPGIYSRGDDVDLGGWLMFKSGIGLEYEVKEKLAFTISFDHRSSGDIWAYNPGMETFQISLSKKFGSI